MAGRDARATGLVSSDIPPLACGGPPAHLAWNQAFLSLIPGMMPP